MLKAEIGSFIRLYLNYQKEIRSVTTDTKLGIPRIRKPRSITRETDRKIENVLWKIFIEYKFYFYRI